MNNNKRPPVHSFGGAAERQKAPQVSKRPTEAQTQRSGYTQMPLRPMTPYPTQKRAPTVPKRVQSRPAQMPKQPLTQQRPVQTQRASGGPVQSGRPVQGQRPASIPQNAVRPENRGTRVAPNASRPSVNDPRRRPVQQMPRDVRPERDLRAGSRTGATQKRPTQERRLRQNDWIVPEGSPVYTAEGRMYESKGRQQNDLRRTPDPRRKQGASRPEPKKKKKKINKERVLLHVKTFFLRLVTMLLIVSLLGLWWYRAEFYSPNDDRSGKVTFTLDSERTYTAKAKTAYRGDVLYVDFTEVAEWFGMVSVGSVNAMRFICTEGVSETSSGKGGEEYAIFQSDSTTVFVNGQCLSLEAPCRTVDTHIWIPLSFVENYVSGIVCDRGAKGTDITFSPEGEISEDEEETELAASFKVKAQNALSHVEYPD